MTVKSRFVLLFLLLILKCQSISLSAANASDPPILEDFSCLEEIENPFCSTSIEDIVSASVSRRQYKEGTGNGATATFDSAPIQGNLLVVIGGHRKDAQDNTISGSGWTQHVYFNAFSGDSNSRRGMAIWTKIAGANEPLTITTDVGSSLSKILIQEFEVTGGTFTSIDQSASNQGTTSGSTWLSTGTTSTTTSANTLVIGAMIGRYSCGNTPNFGNGLHSTIGSNDATSDYPSMWSGFVHRTSTGTQDSPVSWSSSILSSAGIIAYKIYVNGGGSGGNCNVVNNHEFDSGSTGWVLSNNSSGTGVSTLIIDNTGQLSGIYSAEVDIDNASSSAWHIQLYQGNHSIDVSKNYNISFRARATANRSIGFRIQEGASPWTNYYSVTQNITTSAQTYTYNNISVSGSSSNARLIFDLGLSTADVYIDEVIFEEVGCQSGGGGGSCDSGYTLDHYGEGCSGSGINITVPNLSNVIETTIENVYKGCDPGSSVTVSSSIGNLTLNEVSVAGGSSDVRVYRTVVSQAVTNLNATSDCGTCGTGNGLQSMMVYAKRSVNNNVGYSTVTMDLSDYCGIETFNIPISTADAPRDVDVVLPLSEITDDGRYLTVVASSNTGSASATQTINGPDLSLGCCFYLMELTIPNVPANTTAINISILTDGANNPNGSGSCGQSYAVGGTIYTATECPCENLTNGGTIGSNEINCGSYNPAMITNITLPSGGLGSYIEYQWQQRNQPCGGNYGSWVTISGATDSTYDPPTIGLTTQYRRGAKRDACGPYVYSNSVTKTVVEQFTSGGTVAGNQSVCGGYDPTNITSSAVPSGGCNGSTSYIWQKRDQTCGGGWSSWANISGATSATYNPPAITQTTQYRRVAFRAGGCSPDNVVSNVITKEVVVNYTSAGTIGNNESICGSYDPANIVSLTSPSGGCGGTITYLWQMRDLECGGSWSGFTNIPNSNSATYNPGTITKTTRYRRLVRRGGCPWVYSAEVIKEVVEQYTDGGTIAGNQALCGGYDPSNITSTTLATGGCGGTPYYIWQKRERPCGGSYGFWSTISGANASTYNPGSITMTTQYRRLSRRMAGCSPGWSYSNVVTKEVIEQYSSAGTIGGNQSICGGYDPSTITNSSIGTGGCGGTPNYLWQKRSMPCGGSYGAWSNISSNTPTYDPPAITETTQYRRLERRTTGCSPVWLYSNIITKVVVQQTTDGGDITGDEVQCGGYDPEVIGSTSPATGGCGGTIAYYWGRRTINCDGTKSAFTNWWDGETYDPGPITQTTEYIRRARRMGGCSPSWSYSNYVVKEVVEQYTSAGSIAGDETVCGDSFDPAPITSSADPTGGCHGTETHVWQRAVWNCSTGTFNSWENFGVTGVLTYDPPVITETTKYRRVSYRNSTCTVPWVITNEVTKTLQKQFDGPGTISGNESKCSGFDPANITSTSTPTGGCSGTLAYNWQYREYNCAANSYGSWISIPSSNAATYNPPAITVTTQYRRRAKNGDGCSPLWRSSATVTKEVVQPYTSGGTITGDETVCGSSYNPSNIASTALPSGGCGGTQEIRWYKWELNCTTGTYGTAILISGATGASYDPPTITTTTRYRRYARLSSDCTGTNGTWHVSNYVYKYLNQDLVNGGTISADQENCGSFVPALIVGTVPTGGCSSQNISYLWQYRLGEGGPWIDIPDATSKDYQSSIATITGQIRRKVSTETCGDLFSNEVTIIVNNPPTATLDDSSFCPSESTVLEPEVCESYPDIHAQRLYTTSSWGTELYGGGSALTGDGSLCFDITDFSTAASYQMIGLNSDPNTNEHFNTIDYAMYIVPALNNYRVIVYENGANRGQKYQSTASYVGSTFCVRRTGSTIEYLKDDVVIFTSTVASSGSLYYDNSFHSGNASQFAKFENINLCADASDIGMTYAWSGGGSGATKTISSAGTYTVTVTDNHGCTTTASATVTQNTPPVASAVNDGPLTCAITSVTLTANPAGVTYAWSGGGTNRTKVVTEPGTYTVTVTDSNGCTDTAQTTVVQNNTPTNVFCQQYRILQHGGSWGPWTPFGANCEIELCELDGLSDIQVDGGPNINTGWVWEDEDGNIDSEVDEQVVFTNIDASDAGTYTATLTNSNGCVSSFTFDVTVIATATVTVTGDSQVCVGETASLSGSTTGGLGTATYQWQSSMNNTNWDDITGATSINYTTPAMNATMYFRLVVTWDGNGCSDVTSTTATVNVDNESIALTADAFPPSICPGGSTVLTVNDTINNGGLLDYSNWTTGTGSISGFTANGAADENHRIVDSDPWGNSTVVWEARPNGSGGADGGWNSSKKTIDPTKLYRVSVWVNRKVIGSDGRFYMGTYGYSGATNEIKRVSDGAILTNPYFWISAAPPTTLEEDEWVLVVGHIRPHNHTGTSLHTESGRYTLDEGKIGNISQDFQWLPTSTEAKHRSYLFYSNDNTSRQQWVYPRFDVVDGTEPSIDDLLGGFDVNGGLGEGASWEWYTGSCGGTSVGTGESITVSPSTTTTYYVRGEGGCNTSSCAQVTVTVNTPPVASVSHDGNITCADDNSTMTALPAGMTYAWSGGGTGQTKTVTVPGTYTVTVTDQNGCTDTAQTTVGENTTPTNIFCERYRIYDNTLDVWGAWVNFSGDCVIEMCENNGIDHIQFDGGPNINTGWVWTDEDGNVDSEVDEIVQFNNIGADDAGIYTGVLTNEYGCVSNVSFEVIVNPNPNAGATSNGPLTCDLTTVTMTATPAGMTYAWSSGGTSQSENTTTPGTYSVTVTDSNGCTDEASVVVTQDTTNPTANAGPDDVICNGEDATLTASGGGTYAWSNGLGSNATVTVSPSTTTTYTVTVTAANGCIDTDQVIVTVNPLPTADPGANGNLCSGNTHTWTATNAGTGATYSWNFGAHATPATATGIGPHVVSYDIPSPGIANVATTASVTVTSSDGCVNQASDAFTILAVPQVTLTSNDLSCGNDDGTITVTFLDSPNRTGIEFSIDGGATWTSSVNDNTGSYTFSNLDADTYDVDVRWGDNSCTMDVGTVILDPMDTPDASASNDGPLTCDKINVMLTASSSTSGVSYAWSGGGNNATKSVNTPGTYTVTVTDTSTGCTNTAQTVVTQNIVAPNAAASNDGPLTCDQTTVILTATSTTSGATFAWSNGATSATTSTMVGGTFTVTVTDPNNGCTTTAQTVVVENNTPTNIFCQRYRLNIGGTWGAWTNFNGNCDIEICEDDGLTDFQFDGGPDVNTGWVWTDEDGNIDSEVDEIVQFNNITAADAGTYTGQLTNSNGCISDISFNVIVNPNPNATVVKGRDITCTTLFAYAYPTTNYPGYPQYLQNSEYMSGGASCGSQYLHSDGTNPYSIVAHNLPNSVSGGNTYEFGFDYKKSGGTVVARIAWYETGYVYLSTTTVTLSDATNWTPGSVSAVAPPNAANVQISFLVYGNAQLDSDCWEFGPQGGTPTYTEGFESNSPYEWSGPNGYAGSSRVMYMTEPGTYTVTVTDPNTGCTDTGSVTIDLYNTPPNASASNDGPITCAQPNVTLTASSTTAGATYNWSNGLGTNATASVNAPGTYTVTVTDPSNGCTATAQTVVTEDTDAPNASASNDGPLTCAILSVELTASSTTPGATFAWSGGGTGATKTVTDPGTYTVTVTDPSNGCTSTAQTIVIQNNTPTNVYCQRYRIGYDGVWESWINFSGNCEIEICENDGLYDIQFDGGPDVNTGWVWTDEDGNVDSEVDELVVFADIGLNDAGIYTGVLTNEYGCESTVTFEVIVNENPEASASNDGPLTCAKTDVTLTALPAGMTYAWSGGGTAQTKVVTTPGTYIVTVTDSNGCTDTAQTTVTQDVTNPVADAGADSSICYGDDIELIASGGGTYQWSHGGGNNANFTVNPTTTTTYTVTVTDPTNGCSDEASVTVTVNPLPTVIVSTTDATCELDNGSATATPSGGSGPFTYDWSLQHLELDFASIDGIKIPSTMSLDSAINVNGTISSGYLALDDSDDRVSLPNHAIDGLNDFEISIDFYMNTINSLNAIFSAANASQNNALLIAYNNSTNINVYIMGTNKSYSTSTLVVNQWYTVTVKRIGNQVEVLLDGTSLGTQTMNATAIDSEYACLGEEQDSVDGGYDSNQALEGRIDNVIVKRIYQNNSATLNNLAPGIATVTITDANGCSATNSGTINELPTIISSASNNGPVTCSLPNVTLTALPAGLIYAWSGGGSNQTKTVSTPGTYTVTVTDGNGCTSTAQTIVLEDSEEPNASASNDGPITCAQPNVTLTASSTTTGATYNWSNGLGTNATASVNAPGTYTVTVTDPSNGCTATAQTVVTEDTDAPNASASNDGPLTCAILSVELTASSTTPGATFAWSGGGTGATKTVSDPGTYTVTVTDPNNGCTSTAQTIVIQNNTPTNVYCQRYRIGYDGVWESWINFSGNCEIEICENDGLYDIQFDGGPDVNTGWLWTDEDGNVDSEVDELVVFADIGLDDAGIYTGVLTNEYGCESTVTFEVIVNENPEASASNDGPLTCAKTDVTLTALPAGMTYAWSGGGTAQTKVVTTPGTYTVTVTDSNGCTDTAQTIVTQDVTNPVADAGANDIICTGEDATLTASGGGTYAWSNGLGSNATVTVSPTSTTTYTVTVTSANGCTDTDQVVVTVNPLPTADPGANPSLCSGNTLTWTAANAGVGASYSWDFGLHASPSTASGIGPHEVTYSLPSPGLANVSTSASVTVTSSDGCVNQGSDAFTILAIPQVTLSNTDISCGNDDASITITFLDSPNRSGIEFSINGGSTWSTAVNDNSGSYTFTGLAAGTYDVDARWGDNNCVVDVGSVTIDPKPLPTVTASDDITICPDGTTTISASANGGSGTGYIYNWNNSLGNGSSHEVTINATTTYTVTVTDSNGCVDTDQVTITVAPAPQVTVSVQDATICAGESTTITSNISGGTGTASYQWQQSTLGSVWTDIAGATSTSYSTPSLNASISYRLVVSYTGTGCDDTASNAGTVTVENPSTVVDAISDPEEICLGGSATLSVNTEAKNGGIIDYSTWTVGEGSTTGFSRVGGSTESNRINDIDPWGNTTVVWQAEPNGNGNGDGGWNTSRFDVDNTKLYRFSVWVNRKILGTDGRFYLGTKGYGSVDGVKVVTNGGTSTNPYFWVSETGGTNLLEDEWILVVGHVFPSNHTGTSRHADSGRYTANGGFIGATSLDFAWLPETTEALHRSFLYYANDPAARQQLVYPRVDIVDGTEPSIDDLLNGFDVNGGLGEGASYEWFTGSCGGTLVGTGETITVSPTVTTTYYVRATGDCNTTACESVTVTVNNLPSATATNDGPLTCSKTEAILTATPSGLNYEWSTTETTESITVTSPGTYLVTVTDASGCISTASTTVTQNIVPPVADAGEDQEICDSEDIILTATGGGSYMWSHSAGNTASVTVSPSMTTTYTVTVTAANGCTDTDEVTVEVNEGPTAPGTIAGDEEACGSYDPAIITSENDAVGEVGLPISYNWQKRELNCTNGQWSAWSDITGAHDADYDSPLITTTTQFRRLAGQQGCSSSWLISNVVTKDVIINSTNPGTIAADQTGCDSFDPDEIMGSPATGGCRGTMEYQWQMRTSGGTWTDIAGATGINYNPGTVTETTEFQRLVRSLPCPYVASNIVVMTINRAKLTTATLGSNLDCEGNCTGTIEVEVDHALTGDYMLEYTFEGNVSQVGPFTQNEATITDLCAGSYSNIRVISTNTGCVDVWTGGNISISESHADWEHVTHTDDVSDCHDATCDGSFTVDANLGVTGPYMLTYMFEGSQVEMGPFTSAGDVLIDNLCPGIYSDITITSIESGCTDVWPDDIVIATPDFDANVIGEIDDDCQINEGSVTLRVTNGIYPYTIEWRNEDDSESGSTTLNQHGNITIYGLTGGSTYCFKVTDSNGCVEN